MLSGTPTVYTVDLTSADGAGSNSSGDLVFVIKQANGNTNPAGSEIRFDPAVFSTPKTITLSSTLELSEPVGPEVIDGPGASLVTISGNKKVGVFQVDQGVTATIAGLTISGGSAEFGAGIYDKGILTVDSSTISNNVATGPGGGIYILGLFYFVEVAVNSSTIASNSAVTGGGIQNDSGLLNVSGSLISGNSADFGGGIYNTGTGGNALLGTATVTTCTISGNSANPTNGYGGGIDNSGIMHVTSSTISSNTADIGGGIVIANGDTLILADTTIAGNTAQFNKNVTALTGLGGGIEDEGTLTAVNCTIAYNNGGIGGLDLSSGSTATLDNTIVALNTFEISSGPTASDIYSFGGTVSLASASNLIGTGGSGGLTNGRNGNLIGVANPFLGGAGQ